MKGQPAHGPHTFGLRLSRQTAEGEMVEITCWADTEGELEARLKEAHRVAHGHMVKQNERIMQLADAERQRVEGGPLRVRDEVTHAQLTGRAAKHAREAGDGAASRAAHP